jgi:hypothetical protein
MTLRRLGALARVLLAAYVLAAALLPLAHHDVLCHLKSSTHCTSCTVGSSGETASSAVPLDGLSLPDAGRAVLASLLCRPSAPAQDSAGRSPPPA